MLVTEGALAHVGQLDCTFRACVHEPVATLWMELGRSDDLGKLLHVRRFDVHDVETLVLNVQVPEIDPKIITANEGFSIAIHRYAVDVIGVSIRIGAAWHSSNYGVVVGQTG